MSTPLVSIILPTYKNAPALGRAIESVLAQHFTNWELIIVDDGLEQPAKSIATLYTAEDSRIKVFANERNSGVQRALNCGLAIARGEFIARIDDDDVWIDQTKLESQISFLNEHSDHVLVGTSAVVCDEEGKKLGAYSLPETDDAIRSRMLLKNCFLHPTIMARRTAIASAGNYDEREETKHIEDYALWLALGVFGKFANLPGCMVQLTVHPNSMTARNRIAQAKRMRDIICQYKNIYPNFFFGYMLLSMRYMGFLFISAAPIPKKLLYLIQNLYKKI